MTPQPDSDFDLNRFLSSKAAAGMHDSAGDFTLDTTKAARKLARFSMPHSFSWVLKLVQAAVSFGTDRVSVEQKGTTTSFFFPLPPSVVPSPNDVAKTILSGKLQSEAPLDRLCVALRFVVEQAGLSFVLGLCGEVRLETLYAGPYFSKLAEFERERLGACARPGIRVTIGHRTEWALSTARRGPRLTVTLPRKGIADELRKSAFVSPVPVVLNGEEILDPFQHPEFGFAAPLRPFLLLALPPFNGVELSLAGPFQNELVVPLQSSSRRWLGRAPHPERAGAWALLQILDTAGFTAVTNIQNRKKSFSFASQALWVRDGVVIERTPLPFPSTKMMRLVLMISSEGLETDLTGFSLLESKAKRERLDFWTQSAKLAVRKSAYGNLDKLSLSPEELHAGDKAARKLAFRRRVSKQILAASPLALLDPLLALGLAGSALFLQSVHRRFPDLEGLKALEAAYLDDFRVSLLQLAGIG